MKNPKIVKAMGHVDDDLVSRADTRALQRPAWVKWTAMAASFALILCGLLAVFMMGGMDASATIALDVNPSIEIEVGRGDKVKEVRALNADAEIVIGDMDFKNQDIDITVNALIGSMLVNGYLTADRNSILVSVNSENGAKAQKLQESIRNDIEKALGEGGIEASVISQKYDRGDEVIAIAEDFGISVAKATLVYRAVKAGIAEANGTPYTYETLSGMKIHELKMLLESKHIDLEGVASSGNTAGERIGEEQALEIALAHAGLAKDAVRKIEVEMDYERGVMVYSVEFETRDFEYEYEIDASSGNIVEVEKEAEDDD